MYNSKEFGAKNGAIPVTPSINGGVYSAPSGYCIYEIVPDLSVTIKATPVDTNLPYMSTDRTNAGSAIAKYVPFNGQYSTITVTAGQCDVYLDKLTGNVV